ncbi:dTDP-glucose 4,6-dehydratase [Neobacillus sp. OS1-2]|uniref:dTDP-glucose 4,6-dehydratase n=1 Tax=Neobacillus sp. OS1-2 TaxID=3070680 RepID=UPI0027E007E4|nr:dTDP-glucose 4,6-dehydratase [Neobacillus sp. OS1-2]WML41204.1 dTDP-glucose 4,6-dehydratase [Neobacillus sp. OS1-2]
MKLLITGGAGFIGSNFVRYMVNKYPNYQIVNLDLLTYAGNLENLKDIENAPNYKFVRGDIADREFVQGLFKKEKFDYVINFAAESHVDRSITDPGIFVQTNIQGTLALLDAAKTYNVTKYLQVSTDEVYGTLGETGYFTEETPLAANSPYSASKASADLLVRAYHETFDLPVNITRCSNNYGPYHFPEKLIPLMIINALNDKELPIYGDGLNIRDWLHVEDHCQAIDLVLHKGRNGEVYNVGGNNERTNIDIVKTILKHLNKPESLMKFVQDRPGHDRRYAIDATKLRTELGWSPKYNFETGIEQTINWYLNNQEWWENIISGEYQEYVKSQYGDRLGVE